MTTANPPSSVPPLPHSFDMTLPDNPPVELQELLQKLEDSVAPVWPLKDFVAVNPFLGFTGQPFLKARRYLQMFSDCESLMPLAYYRSQFEQNRLTVDHIEAALRELSEDGVSVTALLSAQDIVDVLMVGDEGDSSNSASRPVGKGAAAPGRLELASEVYDRHTETNWTTTFLHEVSRFCAGHYDTGQAGWQSPWKGLPLYQAWLSAAVLDRRVEVLGLKGFRKFVSQLPKTPDSAVYALLHQLEVPQNLWESMLGCTAFSMPGWSAWARYQTQQAERNGTKSDDFVALLAIRLAYDAALCSSNAFSSHWKIDHASASANVTMTSDEDDSLVRFVLLRASEIAWRNGLTTQLSESITTSDVEEEFSIPESIQSDSGEDKRASAQIVFCIDVRSERFRRKLEAATDSVETFGFAGFFGVPIEFAPLGECEGSSQVPAMLTPQFQVEEGIRSTDQSTEEGAVSARKLVRSIRKSWKKFQTSASGCFGFVETAGVFSGIKLLLKSTGQHGNSCGHRHDGIPKQNQNQVAPSLEGLVKQGLTVERQAEMVAGILRGIGITENFARLVVFCGHGSQTENNPLQAGLDCGACGGHSGEPNARFAAAMMNQPAVRAALVEHGLKVPADVHFLAALHNTASDEITFFDVDQLPLSHSHDLEDLIQSTKTASQQTRLERLPSLASGEASDVFRRIKDWSEVRPEWGLAGNAAFIAGPRSITSSINLDGRSFLHSYDFRNDEGFQVLEQIMTAPMVVAHWINMQYYGSTVDHQHFGSGSKTIHNVVGLFGVLSGNAGDLTTGLAWQSLHNGTEYQHKPLRLQAVIAAPRSAIDNIVAKHSLLDDLLGNAWLHLIAIEDGKLYRYSASSDWQIIGQTHLQPA